MSVRFSIVIPTRNRAAKLQHALRSALGQRFDDYEVVVSNNQSTDDTEAVVLAQQQPRLRYVVAPRSMSMVDHWEFALAQARGEWVLFVCDDDALMPSALGRLDEVSRQWPRIELIQYGVLNFVYADGTAADGNYVDLPRRLSTHVRRHDARACLRQNFRRLSGDMPKFLNAAVHVRLIDRLKQRYGRVFWDWAPDYSSASLLLANTREFLHVGPLMLWGENQESYGAGSARDPAHLARFFSQFESFTGTLPLADYPELLTVQNCVYDTFCRVRQLLGDEASDLRIDPIRYRQILLKDCQRYLAGGHTQYTAAVAQLQTDLHHLRRQRALSLIWSTQSAADALSDTIRRLTRSLHRRLTGSKPTHRHHYANIQEAATSVAQRATA